MNNEKFRKTMKAQGHWRSGTTQSSSGSQSHLPERGPSISKTKGTWANDIPTNKNIDILPPLSIAGHAHTMPNYSTKSSTVKNKTLDKLPPIKTKMNLPEQEKKHLVTKKSTYELYVEKRTRELNNIRSNLSFIFGGEFHEPGTIMHTAKNDCDERVKGDSFGAAYTKDKWVFIDSIRGHHDLYHMSDVAAEQYTIISKRDNFFGKLPSIIRRHNISNDHTNAILEQTRHLPNEKRLKIFLNETVNGKSTMRIADAFGMEPSAMKEVIEYGIRGVNIYVRPKQL